MEKGKILFVLPRMNNGGTERVASILANHLCRTYDITLLVLVSDTSFYPLEKEVRFVSANFAINRTSKGARIISLARNFGNAVCFVRREIRERRPQIVFSLLPEADIITTLALTGVQGVYHVSSERNDPTVRNRWGQFALNQIYRRCSCFVCQSQSVACWYNNIPQENKVIIPNPVDFDHYPPPVPESQQTRVVAVGRLRPQKNFDLLIDSFSAIAPRYSEVQLDIYGEGPLREHLQGKIHTLGLDGRVNLRGASKQVLTDIRDAAVFVMSSDYEGFPNALVEAIAMGLPVISTDFASGVAREIINPAIGLVVPCGDRDAMASALDDLLSHPERRAEMRKNGRKAVELFACDRVIDTWDRFFRNLMEGKEKGIKE